VQDATVAKRRKKGIPGLSFSWKRATGVTAAKAKIARATGVPLTKAGRQRKVGKALGCCVPLAFLVVALTAASYGVGQLLQTLAS
jgi:hypothetical protein